MSDPVEIQKRALAHPATPSWLPFLDGVRGYMALWVMVGHAGWLCGNHIPILTEAQLAVNVFMVLSGLLMAHHFLNRQHAEPWEAPSTWWIFYIRRFFRIAPLYYVCLAIAFVFNAQYSGFFHEITEIHVPSQMYIADAYAQRCLATPGNVLMHFSFLFGFCPRYANTTCLPDWSIGLEMQFYLAFPFLMLACRRFGPVLLLAALLALQTYTTGQLLGSWGDGDITWNRFLQPTFLPFKIGFFLCGMFLAFAYHHRNETGRYALYLLLAAFAVNWGSLHSMVPALTIAIGAMLFLPTESSVGDGLGLVRWLRNFMTNRVSRLFRGHLLRRVFTAPAHHGAHRRLALPTGRPPALVLEHRAHGRAGKSRDPTAAVLQLGSDAVRRAPRHRPGQAPGPKSPRPRNR